MEAKDEEAAAEEVGLTVIMAEEQKEKSERKMFKRLKLVMVFDNIKYVCVLTLLYLL